MQVTFLCCDRIPEQVTLKEEKVYSGSVLVSSVCSCSAPLFPGFGEAGDYGGNHEVELHLTVDTEGVPG